MTQVYFADSSLVDKYSSYLGQLDVDSPSNDKTLFTQAIPCVLNPGILLASGDPIMKNFIYVDDCWLIAVWYLMPRLLAACLHAIFVVMGFPDETLRPNPVAMDKWVGTKVGWETFILGLVINTRAMIIGITDQYKQEVIDLLTQHWSSTQKLFTVTEIEKLAGKLARLAEGANWVFHLMPNIYMSIAHCLRSNDSWLIRNSKDFRALIEKPRNFVLIGPQTRIPRRLILPLN